MVMENGKLKMENDKDSQLSTVHSPFKKTDIGIIPEDWDVKPLNALCQYQNGIAHEHFFNKISGYKVVSIGNFSVTGKYVENNCYIDTSLKHVISNFILNKNDLAIILNDKTSVGTIIGRSILIDKDDYYVMNQRTMRLKIVNQLSPFYLHFYLNSPLSHDRFVKLAKPGTQIYVNTDDVLNFLIPIPNTEEQKLIAAALSDVDGLIESLEQLIEKKRDIKTAAMQQLLTGKKRLPGFEEKNGFKKTDIGIIPEDWDVQPVSALCDIVSGGTPSTANPDFWFKGDIPLCTPSDITRTSGKYLYKTDRNITPLGLSKSAANLLPEGSLLLCSRATIGEVKIAKRQIATNQGFKSLVCHSVNNEFMYYKVLTLKDRLLQFSIGSTFLEFSKKDIARLQIDFPKPEEQSAIASVFSDMDTEIDALEQRLAKARSLKTGMMQELLTGKTRLING